MRELAGRRIIGGRRLKVRAGDDIEKRPWVFLAVTIASLLGAALLLVAAGVFAATPEPSGGNAQSAPGRRGPGLPGAPCRILTHDMRPDRPCGVMFGRDAKRRTPSWTPSAGTSSSAN
jgi:hypothetical protein